MFSFQPRSSRCLLWLLALAVLCFAAAQFPEIRARLPWGKPAPTQVG
ncbi:MAG: hypothetical protein M9894_24040 [Planctomycetes bacterium]|nr:hypothetical protein [Planctomycetota bacterium]